MLKTYFEENKVYTRGRHRWKFGPYPVPKKIFWPVPGTQRYQTSKISSVPGTQFLKILEPHSKISYIYTIKAGKYYFTVTFAQNLRFRYIFYFWS